MKKNKPSDSTAAARAGSNNPWLIVGICLFLALMVWGVFGQTWHFSFVNFDDNEYVYENPAVIHGITLGGSAAAFSLDATDNWVPLTMLSHMLDWQFFGANAGGHHLTNVVLHALTAILLFLVLNKMTAALWRSAFVAAVFAIHPLRAESVAWVSERKDVLCGVFFMLTLWAYLGYVRKPQSLWRYFAALMLFALALMSKPVVVTVPIILLLLDFWPLKRFSALTLQRLLIEKIPFFLLSLASCVPTVLAERPGISAKFPLFLRIENALVSYVAYLWQLFYPVKLAALYPFPYHGLSLLEVAGALVVLIVISLAVFHWRRKYPYLLAGWLWYLVMLVPVIGLIQVGEQSRADRHTYLSEIGLVILLTWLVADLSVRLRYRLPLLAGLSALILAALIYSAWAQTAYWKDSEKLWTRTLLCTSDNPSAHLNLGSAFEKDGRLDDAKAQYEQTLELSPNFSLAHYNLGGVLLRQGQLDQSISENQEALKFDQGHAAADDCNNLGVALFQKGQTDHAIQVYQQALEFEPGNADVRNNLGRALLSEGRLEEAAAQYQAALKLQPDNTGFQFSLGATLWTLTKSPGANGDNVLTLAQTADLITDGSSPMMLRALAAAYARCGRFPEAVETGNKALALAQDGQSSAFINTLEQEVALYQAGSPLPLLNQTNSLKR